MSFKDFILKLFKVDADIINLNSKINTLNKLLEDQRIQLELAKFHLDEKDKQVYTLQADKTRLQQTVADLNQQLDLIKKDYAAAEVSLLKFQAQTEDQISALEKAKAELQDAKAKIEELQGKLGQESEVEIKLTTKYPKTDIMYQKEDIDGQYNIDVRNFTAMYHDSCIPTVTGKDYDEIALNAAIWVQTNFKYKYDSENYKFAEYWAWPYQSMKKLIGDCEDGGILTACIMLKSGIPYYRVRIACGSVNGGGHAYCCYARLKDNEFVVMDWCYWPNKLHPSDRPLHRDERNYSDVARNYYVWFSWDFKYCYGRAQTINAKSKKGKIKDEYLNNFIFR